MATRNKNHLKTLINAFRVVSTSTDDLAVCFTRVKHVLEAAVVEEECLKTDASAASKVLDAVLADMRAEDEAAKKPAE